MMLKRQLVWRFGCKSKAQSAFQLHSGKHDFVTSNFHNFLKHSLKFTVRIFFFLHYKSYRSVQTWEQWQQKSNRVTASWWVAARAAGSVPAVGVWWASWRWRTLVGPSCRRCPSRPGSLREGKRELWFGSAATSRKERRSWTLVAVFTQNAHTSSWREAQIQDDWAEKTGVDKLRRGHIHMHTHTQTHRQSSYQISARTAGDRPDRRKNFLACSPKQNNNEK